MSTTAVTLLCAGMLAVFIAALLGGLTGFGYGLVSVPLLLLIGFPLGEVVAVNLTIGLLTRIAVLYRLREHIHRRYAAILVVGSVPGILLGREIARIVDATALKVAAGALAVLFAGLLLLQPGSAQTAGSRIGGLVAGAAGGVLATTTSFNGVPPVLWLSRRNREPVAFIADLAAYFVVGNIVAVALLMADRTVTAHRFGELLLAWLPAGIAGNAVGLHAAKRLRQDTFRTVTLGVVLIAGASTAATALVPTPP